MLDKSKHNSMWWFWNVFGHKGCQIHVLRLPYIRLHVMLFLTIAPAINILMGNVRFCGIRNRIMTFRKVEHHQGCHFVHQGCQFSMNFLRFSWLFNVIYFKWWYGFWNNTNVILKIVSSIIGYQCWFIYNVCCSCTKK